MIVFQFKEENENDILKWFAGGSERRCEAMSIINHLLEDIKDTPQLTPLKNQLVSYKRRLEDDGTSTPFILNQMNVDVSRVLIDNKLMLSENQARQIKKLRELSAIRYGH
ncbi:bacteriocin immunity protein [Streptococcus oralis subsp. dentisani]|uniref:Bacteriocin immunity protein n=2 Tax=Streptococcus TaxID=1301 RepID=A0A2I1UH38_STROR|nr:MULTISPECIES: bacteriocin immunity protein [Streptococcus]KXA60120.1 hypothetical protein HMPREF3228_01226 [Streptococcus mitis]MDU3981195.1 bacteriocin immunity protein [Streptococcus mitis]PLA05146.1 bacteriocin immunity protein [Streptococcus oralis subsp. dentisani]